MDKLRKFGERLWYNKERIVLAIMVCVLCWNVYRVVQKPPETQQTPHRPPKTILEESSPPLPSPPQVRVPTAWKAVYTPNPFWYYSTPLEGAGRGNKTEDAGIVLLKLQELPNGKARAQLKTTTAKWYSEGANFESFQLLKIDLQNQSCEVYSERLGKVVVLTIGAK